MSKYGPLGHYLSRQSAGSVVLSFSEIEGIIEASLPASAYKYSAWWANETNPHARHVHCRAWITAGFHAQPHLNRQQATFTKIAE